MSANSEFYWWDPGKPWLTKNLVLVQKIMKEGSICGEGKSACWQRWLLKDFIKRMKLCHWCAGCDLQGIRNRAWEIVHDEGRAHLRKMRSFFHEVRESLIGNVQLQNCNNSQAAQGRFFCSIRHWGSVVCEAEALWGVCSGHGAAASARSLQDKLLNQEMKNSISDTSLCNRDSSSSGLRHN